LHKFYILKFVIISFNEINYVFVYIQNISLPFSSELYYFPT